MEMERMQIIQALGPNADIFASGPNSAAYNISHYEALIGILSIEDAGGGTGVGNVKVKAADNAAKDNPVDVNFHYKKATTDDTYGAITETSSGNGFSTVADEVGVYVFEIRQRKCPEGKNWVYVDTTESVDDPIKGSLVIIGVKPDVAGPNIPSLVA